MKTTLALLSFALLFATACKDENKSPPPPPPDTCSPQPQCAYKPQADGPYVQVHAGNRDCDAIQVAGDVVRTSSQCVQGAKLADVSVEVEGEVLSAVEIRGEADALAIRVDRAFGHE